MELSSISKQFRGKFKPETRNFPGNSRAQSRMKCHDCHSCLVPKRLHKQLHNYWYLEKIPVLEKFLAVQLCSKVVGTACNFLLRRRFCLLLGVVSVMCRLLKNWELYFTVQTKYILYMEENSKVCIHKVSDITRDISSSVELSWPMTHPHQF